HDLESLNVQSKFIIVNVMRPEGVVISVFVSFHCNSRGRDGRRGKERYHFFSNACKQKKASLMKGKLREFFFLCSLSCRPLRCASFSRSHSRMASTEPVSDYARVWWRRTSAGVPRPLPTRPA